MIVCLIPAKEQSERLPGKNTIPFNGRSLLERTIEQARACDFFDKIIVSTDIESVLKKHRDIATIFPGKIYHTGKIPISELIKKVWEKHKPDLLFMLQCTTPHRTKGDIMGCGMNMEQVPEYNSLITVNCDWKPNGAVQITRTGKMYDPPLCVFPTNNYVDIDDIYDFRIAEALLK